MNKIKVAFIVFTELIDLKAHDAYNWWHSSDHIPENLALPGITYAERAFAPPEYMSARLAANPIVSPAQYIMSYYMTEPVAETIKEFAEELPKRLVTMGRMLHQVQRKYYIGGPFFLVKGYVAPQIEISAEALPYRPHKGLFVTLADLVDANQQEAIAQWYDRVHLPDMLTVKGVTGVYWFASQPGNFGSIVESNPPGRFVHLYYLDDNPLEMLADLKTKLPQWRAAGRVMDLSKSVRLLLSGPYQTMYPFQVRF